MTDLSLLPAQTPATTGTPVVSRLSASADPAKVMKAAQDFEAMAIGQLLQPMFETVDLSGGEFGGGAGEKAWQPMLVQEFAKEMAAHGGIGLAKPVYEAMMRMNKENNR
jgi:flagellar protein FlgJ